MCAQRGLAARRLLVEGPDELLDELLVRIRLLGACLRELLLFRDVSAPPACVIKTNLEISALVAVEVYESRLLDEDGSVLGRAVDWRVVRRRGRWLHPSLEELVGVLAVYRATRLQAFLGFAQRAVSSKDVQERKRLFLWLLTSESLQDRCWTGLEQSAAIVSETLRGTRILVATVEALGFHERLHEFGVVLVVRFLNLRVMETLLPLA